ncbi:MAG: Lrp/AsnC family transcriptional regulator [Thermoprotei archaeon]|nr:MAG: Lrp/AsnC family transcriptional regulator [Thermoprotei archaeon]
MAIVVFILIQTAPGKANAVVEAIRKIEGVKEAYLVTGPYDIIAKIEVADLEELKELVLAKVHTIEGVVRTLTCITV